MGKELDIQDILQGIDQLRQSQAESGKKFDREMDKLRQSQAESGKKFDREMDKLRQSQAESGKKFDIEMDKLRNFQAETSKQMKETFRKLDSLGAQLAAIGLNTGQSAEEFFFRSVRKTLKLAGIQFDRIERNVSLSEESPEFDMMLINGSHVMLLEVKYKAHPDQVEELAKGKTKFFRKQYTDYRNHALHFGIASMIAKQDLIKASQKAGVYLITQQGDHVAVANDYLKSW